MGISKPDTVLNTLDSLSLKGGNVVDDCCDKLVSHVFVYVLILFAVIAGIHEYSGTTINCLPHSKDGKVTDDMVKHLNRFCVTQTLYYYSDFWRPTRLPPVTTPSRGASPPATTTPASAPSNVSSCSTLAADRRPPHSSDRQKNERAKRAAFAGSGLAGERIETASGRSAESQAASVVREEETTASNPSRESTSVSASSSEVSSSASKVPETATEATTEQSSARATSGAFSGEEESTRTVSAGTQTPPTSSKESKPASEGTVTSETQSSPSTRQNSAATTSFPVGGQKTGSTTPTASGSKAATTGEDQKGASPTPATWATKTFATSATKTPANAGQQAPATENSATEEHKDLHHPTTSQRVLTMGGETLYANEITHMITVVFVLQAIILKLPQILWKELLEKTGTNLQTLITRLMDEQFEDPAKRERTIQKFACNLPKAVKSDTVGLLQRKGWRRGQKLMTFFQSNIFWLYVSIKLLYIVVLVFQGWLLSTFFAFNFRDFGVSYITKEILKQPVSYVTDFPTVVLCNFRSPTLNMPWEGVWVQCVLVFNNFLQNMLLIEWLGILILSVAMVLSIATWIYWRWSEQGNVTLIHNLLSVNLHTSLPPSPGHELEDVVHAGEAAHKSDPESLGALDWEQELRDGDKLSRFIDDFLGADGMFLLRIVKANTNRVVMAELTTQLYKLFAIYDASQGQ